MLGQQHLDLQSIAQLFQATLSADTKLRVKAELKLNEISTQPTFPSSTLHIVQSGQVDAAIRLSAAVFFKNWVKNHWDEDQQQQEDKQQIRQLIVSALIDAPHATQSQLSQSLGAILSHDYPSKFESFLPQCILSLNSSEPKVVYGGLIALYELVNVYRWKTAEKRVPLLNIVKAAFPQILQIAQNMVPAVANGDAASAEMVKIIFKTYFCAVQFDLPVPLQQQQVLVSWFTLFAQVIDMPVADTPAEKEELRQHPIFKAKKWAFHVINRIFSRYGSTMPSSHADKRFYKKFSAMFLDQFAPQLLTTVLSQADKLAQGQIKLPDRIVYLLITFLSESLKPKSTWLLLKPHLQAIIRNVVFPLVCFSESDKELWEDEPAEYIQKKLDPMEDYSNHVSAALNFVLQLVKDRQATFPEILSFVNEVLTSFAITFSQRDGALNIFATLSSNIFGKKSPVSKEQLSQVLSQYVVPHLESTEPFLRMSASKALMEYCDVDREDVLVINFGTATDDLTDGWMMVFQKTIALMSKQEPLPVRVQAAELLGRIVERKGMRDRAAPSIGSIMQELLQLTNDIDLESLTAVLERLVEIFPGEVTPFSVQLVTQLQVTFLRIMSETQAVVDSASTDCNDAWDDQHAEKMMTAMGLLKTISTLVLSLQASKAENESDLKKAVCPESHQKQLALLASLEEVSLPCIIYVLQKEVGELYDDVFELLDSLQFQQKAISENLWHLFELVYRCVLGSGCDYTEEIMPCLDNYLSYGGSVVSAHPELQAKFYELIQQLITKSSDDDTDDKILGFKLMESFLMNCKGFVNDYLPGLLEMALTQQNSALSNSSTSYSIYTLEGVINCVWYNPLATVQLLGQANQLENFFSLWLNSQSKLVRVHDKKLSIMALLKLIEDGSADWQQVQSLKKGWPQLMKLLLNCFSTLPKAIQIRKEMEDLYDTDSESSQDNDSDFDPNAPEDDGDIGSDTDFLDYDENGEVQDVEGGQYINFLSKAAQDGQSSDSDKEDWSQELGEELYFTSLLDEINVYACFKQAMMNISQQNPESYALLAQDLTIQEQQLAQEVIQQAELQQK